MMPNYSSYLASLRLNAAAVLRPPDDDVPVAGTAVVRDHGIVLPCTPARTRKSVGSASAAAALEKARKATNKAATGMLSQTQLRAANKQRKSDLTAAGEKVTALLRQAAAVNADCVELQAELEVMRCDKIAADLDLANTTARSATVAATHLQTRTRTWRPRTSKRADTLKLQKLQAMADAAAAAIEEHKEWEAMRALAETASASLLAKSRQDTVLADTRTTELVRDHHKFELDSLMYARAADKTAALQRDEQNELLRQKSIEAAVAKGDAKGTSRLLEYCEHDNKRQRTAQERDERRYNEAIQASREDEAVRAKASVGAAKEAAAERLSIAQLSHQQRQLQQQPQLHHQQQQRWHEHSRSWEEAQQQQQW